ncbi:MAG TPA: hypothetical protein VN032_05520 [Thermoanaerobaculia bacterium]|jgi:hypothetical protein|nr:hypothetical protein [Thermoanaerobaculia bacterium]
MKRTAFAAAVLLTAFAAAAAAQLVPLARCHAAFPCSAPYGLRPADAVSNLPDAAVGSSLIGIGVGLDNGFKPRLAAPAASEDPAESAARMFVHRNPLRTRTPTPAAAPPPAPTPAAR